ncbi:MAG: DUF3566 domain-containing protein, partial [Actinomycetota bacterium]|nr:DUF3566 domain-containing protein [Actinomycetota bacterium]
SAGAPDAGRVAASAPPTGVTGSAAQGPAVQHVARQGAGVSGSGAQPAAATGTRRARLAVSRVDPWSVMKLGFLLSIAMGIVGLVAVAAVWYTLDAMGVFATVGKLVSDMAGINIMQYVGLNKVMGVATMLAVVNIILMTALSTLAAFLYNICGSLVGGLNVTLASDD